MEIIIFITAFISAFMLSSHVSGHHEGHKKEKGLLFHTKMGMRYMFIIMLGQV
jgi:hypothetical protein